MYCDDSGVAWLGAARDGSLEKMLNFRKFCSSPALSEKKSDEKKRVVATRVSHPQIPCISIFYTVFVNAMKGFFSSTCNFFHP